MLVPSGPTYALPGHDLQWFDDDQPSRLLQRWLQISRAVFSKITNRHPPCDLYPFAAYIWLLEDRGLALHEYPSVVSRVVIYAEKHSSVTFDVACPGRPSARDNVENVVLVLEPAGNYIGPALIIQRANTAEWFAREKRGDFSVRQAA